MTLFKIGSLDITPYIVVPSYKVNSIPKYEEWTDSNYTLHRDVTRKRIEGTFKVRFDSLSIYETFLNTLNSNTVTDGSTNVTVYTHNTRSTKPTNVFISYDPSNNLPIMGMSDDDGFEITITER